MCRQRPRSIYDLHIFKFFRPLLKGPEELFCVRRRPAFLIILLGIINILNCQLVRVPAASAFPDLVVVIEIVLLIQVRAAAVAVPLDPRKELV